MSTVWFPYQYDVRRHSGVNYLVRRGGNYKPGTTNMPWLDVAEFYDADLAYSVARSLNAGTQP